MTARRRDVTVEDHSNELPAKSSFLFPLGDGVFLPFVFFTYCSLIKGMEVRCQDNFPKHRYIEYRMSWLK